MTETLTTHDKLMALIENETKMKRLGTWTVKDRWWSGVLLKSLRSPETNYLPKGRLATVAATLKVSKRELSDRMRVAEAYRTDAEFQKAAQSCRYVWTGILRSLPPTREARTGSTRPPKNWRRMVYDGLGLMLDRREGTREQRHAAQKLYDLLNDTDDDG